MTELECPGLPASWLNAWLAAVGTTVLVPSLRLSWTDSPNPHAVLVTDSDVDPVDAVAAAWPTAERIADMPIARERRGSVPFPRNAALRAFQARAGECRCHRDSWTLSSTVTDLYVTESDVQKASVTHSKLDPPVPKGLTLHDRLVQLVGFVTEPSESLRHSMAGDGQRVTANGLGFDATRLTALGDGSSNRVDPIIESLAFFGLALMPLRGNGVCGDWRGISGSVASRPRCWHLSDTRRTRRMCWPAWTPSLGKFGIDALLDCWKPQDRRSWRSLDVNAGWASVEYKGRGQNDATRGIGSEALH